MRQAMLRCDPTRNNGNQKMNAGAMEIEVRTCLQIANLQHVRWTDLILIEYGESDKRTTSTLMLGVDWEFAIDSDFGPEQNMEQPP